MSPLQKQKSSTRQLFPEDKEEQVKAFHEWSLGAFIDVAYELGVLKLDVKKFSMNCGISTITSIPIRARI